MNEHVLSILTKGTVGEHTLEKSINRSRYSSGGSNDEGHVQLVLAVGSPSYERLAQRDFIVLISRHYNYAMVPESGVVSG